MHSQWEELIPLYVAGMLSPSERDALERHLAACDTCARILEEWRTTAAVVRDAAEQWSKGLPPLSPKLRERVAGRAIVQNAFVDAARTAPTIQHLPQVPQRSYAASETRMRAPSVSRVPFTLAAAVMILCLLGGAVLFMILRPAPPANTLAFGVTGTAQAMQPAATATDSDNAAPSRATEDDMGIILVASMTPSPTPMIVQTQVLPSTATPLPPPILPTATPADLASVGIGGGSGSEMPTTDVFSIAAQPVDSCMLSPAGDVAVAVYQFAGTQHAVVGVIQPGEIFTTNAIDGSGWFQVIAISGGNWGWVNGVEVVVQGTLCASLQLPTPTQIVSEPSDVSCSVINTSGVNVNIFAAPFLEASVVGALAADSSARVSGRSVNGWFLIEFTAGSGVFSGWIGPSALTTAGECDNLPVIG